MYIYGYASTLEMVKDFAHGKFPHVTDDKQIQAVNNQASGRATELEGNLRPDFYKSIDYSDMYRYYKDLRKYNHEYARELTSYFRKFADQFFNEPESIHKLSNHKRAWVLNAMCGFGAYYEYVTKGNRNADDMVRNLIRKYQLNLGLDIKHKIYLVDDDYLRTS